MRKFPVSSAPQIMCDYVALVGVLFQELSFIDVLLL